MLLSELPSDFQLGLRKELEPGEQVQWITQPDVDAIAGSLLPYSVTWLSGLFLMAVSMLLNSPEDAASLRGGLIFLLVIVAAAGVLELIFVPRRAARTAYVVTNKRVLTVCITKKVSDYEEFEGKRILREDPSTAQGFYMTNLPSQLLLVLAGMDVVRALSTKFDIFLAAGFGLVLVGWVRPWIYEMKFPVAKFREAPRVLYVIDDMFIVTQALDRSVIKHLKLRRFKGELYNIFVISDNNGVIRFRAVRGVPVMQELITCLALPG